MAEQAPVMGVLQRALSRREGLGKTEAEANGVSSAFDSKRVLPHVEEDDLHEDVTSSSPFAMANLLQLKEVSTSNK